MLAGLAGAPAATAKAGWGRPFRLTDPYTTDLTPVGLAMSSRGAAAAAFSVQDQDHPAVSDPFVAIRAAGGGVSPAFAVPGAQLVLDLGYDASGLRLLTGTSEPGNACCSTVKAVSLLRTGRFGRASTLVGKLAGATLGSLTALPSGQLLATIATDRGVWVAQTRAGGAFGGTRRLTAASAMPWTAAATADSHGQTTVAWTATTGQQGEIAPTRILASTGSERALPGASRSIVSAGGGRRIDELSLAPLASGATAAWTESWFDNRGVYQVQPYLSDVRPGARPRGFPVVGQIASGLMIVGDGGGNELVTWKTCNRSGSCTAVATVRPPGGRFGALQRLGPIDPGQSPAAAIGRGGDALVGWISSGHVYAAERRPRAGRLDPAQLVSNTSYATNLTLTFGSSGTALAAWTQGTFMPDVVGAAFRGS
jgi:hypothetical protein